MSVPRLPNFADFFRALWQKDPFPWQTALARWIEEKGRWPDTISVPTSAGKTAVIDIAVYALAQGWLAAATRIFFVVDRRLVVDEARDRADAIRDAIAKIPALESVRAALRERSGSDQFLHVSTMRGGMPLETAWARSPLQPTVCLTTVDQLGSRLLFRGYGVSPKMDPIHAGLASTDSLIILDEAHLSEPFRQTLARLKDYRSNRWCREMVGRGLQFTSMSATLHSGTQAEATHFEFQETYLPDDNPSEVLRRRLTTPKLAKLVTVGDASVSPWKKPPQSNRAELYRWRLQEPQRLKALELKCTDLARESLTHPGFPKVIGVILNRVNSARSVFEQLLKWNADNYDAADVILLTGRSRPIEREALVEEYWERIRAGRARNLGGRPIMVVATQCIEAGVNLDFDALITELASLDALRQRFGRLDRLGEFRHSGAWIVARADHATNGDEAIYGLASMRTCALLEGRAATRSGEALANEKLASKARVERAREEGKRLKADAAGQAKVHQNRAEIEALRDAVKGQADTLIEEAKAQHQVARQAIAASGSIVDFGISAFQLPADLACYVPAPKGAPTLMPAHLDFFAQTNPNPAPDPDPAIFLHGPKTEPGGINFVWRADLPEDIALWSKTLSVLPPSTAEALSLPIYAAKQWLANMPVGAVVDLEGTPLSESDLGSVGQLRHCGLIWKGKRKEAVGLAKIDDLARLKPGDVIVLHASAGGVDRFGWNPGSDAPARDLADLALSKQRARPTLRLHPALISSWFNHTRKPPVEARAELVNAVRGTRRPLDDDLATASPTDEIECVLRLIQESDFVLCEIQDIADGVTKALKGPAPKSYANGIGWICSGRKAASKAPVFLWEDEDSSLADDRRTLEDHASDVVTVLSRWLKKLALPSEIERTLALFPQLHDIGKTDPRFQDFLCGGPLEFDGRKVLAKSDDGELSREEIRERWKQCALPDGWRHEFCSLDLIETNPTLVDGIPKKRHPLLRHIVGAHHGFGRILPPVIDNTDAPVFACDLAGGHCRLVKRRDLHRLDSGWIDQFAALQLQFGWHGLAFLEAIVRLADHVASARPE